jgi:hypothetical protein
MSSRRGATRAATPATRTAPDGDRKRAHAWNHAWNVEFNSQGSGDVLQCRLCPTAAMMAEAANGRLHDPLAAFFFSCP